MSETTTIMEKKDVGEWVSSGCPHCGSRNVREILSVNEVPTQDGVLWDSPEEAMRSPVGDISLAMCSDCGLVGNQAYEAEKVVFTSYDVATDYSPSFQTFIRELVERLVATHSIRKRQVLEVGCGRGFFLRTICDEGANQGVGIDPSQTALSRAEPHASVQLINDYFSEESLGIPFDLFVSRQVLDILPDQPGFLALLRKAMKRQKGAIAYLEVPNAAHTFGDQIVWNLVYEHRIWYFESSFRALLEMNGFDVIRLAPCWNDEYLGAEIRLAGSDGASGKNEERHFSEIKSDLDRFRVGYSTAVDSWQQRLEGLLTQYQKPVMWGAGARAIAFLAAVGVGDWNLQTVDINPSRQGKYLPRTNKPVLRPDDLPGLAPDLVIITNPTYADEIRQQGAALGLRCDFIEL